MAAQPTFELPDVAPVVLHDVRDVMGWVRVAGDAVTGLRACLDDERVPVLAGDVQAIQRLVRRLDAARLAALSRIDAARNPNPLSPNGSDAPAADPVGDDGAASTGAWYSKATRTDGAAAASDANLARRLGGEDLGSTREAMDDGSLSAEHAKVIAKAMADLPAGLTVKERQQVERHLVEQARILDPARLRRVARRALAALQRPEEEVDKEHGEQLRSEEERARAKSRLTWHDNGDGTTSGHFTIPSAAASVLRKILEQMTAPRRQNGSAAASGSTAGSTADGRFGRGSGSGAAFYRDHGPAPQNAASGAVGRTGPAAQLRRTLAATPARRRPASRQPTTPTATASSTARP